MRSFNRLFVFERYTYKSEPVYCTGRLYRTYRTIAKKILPINPQLLRIFEQKNYNKNSLRKDYRTKGSLSLNLLHKYFSQKLSASKAKWDINNSLYYILYASINYTIQQYVPMYVFSYLTTIYSVIYRAVIRDLTWHTLKKIDPDWRPSRPIGGWIGARRGQSAAGISRFRAPQRTRPSATDEKWMSQ